MVQFVVKLPALSTSAWRLLWNYLSMFELEKYVQTSIIADHGVKSVNKKEKKSKKTQIAINITKNIT